MRKLLMITGLIAAIAAPVSFAPTAASAANSNTRCERSKQNDRVAGTVAGGAVGALLGSSIAGRGSRTEGAVLGGLVGAVAGNQIVKKGSNPCPAGYVQRTYSNSSRRNVASNCRWEDRSYRDAYGNRIARQVQVCR